MRRRSIASSKPAKARRHKAVTPKVARLTPELSEALDQQAATSEVLRIISSSPTDVQPVFGTIAQSAARLCKAQFCYVFRFDGKLIHFAAQYGLAPKGVEAIRRVYPIVPGRASAAARSILSGTVEEIPDIHADHDYEHGHTAKIMAYRSIVAVPMLKDGRPIGAVAMARSQTGRFPGRQVELLKTFADQAVIAIENVRLFEAEQQRTRELTEALEQQTATSNVLRVISSSSGELEPVFEAMLANSVRLCKASYGALWLREGAGWRNVTFYGELPKAYTGQWQRGMVTQAGVDAPMDRAARSRKPVHIPDCRIDQSYLGRHPLFVNAVDVGGIRTYLGVPMLKANEIVGVISIYRTEVRPFTDKQIELLTNFAAQAVIAIENARLLSELRESLQQQTATADVLKVISRSTFDLQAVFGTLIESAVRLCEARFGAIFRLDHDLLHLAAQHNFPESQLALLQGEYPMTLNRGHISGRAILTGAPVQVPDTLADQEYRGRASKEANFRSLLAVPLLRGGQAIGAIVIYRIEPGTFADKQLALLQTFADQAVIAIENVRLFEAEQQRTRELTESLDQQTATSEILKVISSSPGQLKPVFQSILENATRICEASFGTFLLLEGDSFRRVAFHNAPAKYAEFSKKDPLIHRGQSVSLNRIIETKQPDHVADMRLQEVDSPIAKHGGARTLLTVPMLKENELLGAIGIYRQEVRPFTDKQIGLVASFAAQAVIAIENARLLNELRESLDQQTATSEVLRVISSSPGELKAVFQAMLENAVRICEATFGTLCLCEGSKFRGVAAHSKQSYVNYFQDNSVFDLKDNPGIPLDRAANTKQVVHIPDLQADQSYIGKNPRIKQFVELGGARTTAVIPMLKEGDLVGAIIIYRQDVRPFTDKQIELVRNFAAQAVIAIENTRLLNELREALEQQTATSEVLRVISSSPTNVQPVFDSIAESAVRLCGGQFSFVTRLDGNVMNFASCFGLSAEGLDAFRSLFPLSASDDTVSGRAILQRTIVEIADVEADAAYGGQSQHLARTANYRSIVGVPLLHESNPIGAIAVARAHAGSFPERQIALLQAFADQAVIAIRNVRLFDEVQARTNDLTESLEQQMATSEVLKVISNSVSDLQAVFDTMAENAVKLCEAERGYIFRFDGKLLQAVAAYNVGPENWEYVSQNPIAPGRQTVSARAALERQTVQVTDVQTDPEYTYVARDIEPIHSVLAVPILKGDELVGTITIYRLEIKPFTDKQIALVETFAAQAVIAIENTRLLTELRESLQQQTATADVLKAISRSTFDLNTVLRTLVEAAARLCEADQGTIAREQDGVFVRVATYGFSAEFTEIVTHMAVVRDRSSGTGRALLEGRTVHIPDVQSDPDYTFSKAKELGGFRTVLAVPMLRDGAAIGVFALTRINVRPFTDKQIELVTTFADQAAIAIENVRLFESEEARTRELAKSLEELRTAQDRLVHTQKLASLGQLTAGIAHEIKNPLNFVNNFSGVSGELLDELNEAIGRVTLDEGIQSEIAELMDTLCGNLEKIVQHGKRADSIVKNMLLHSREGSGEHRPVDINLVLEESLNLAYHGARAEKQGFNITLERSFDPAAGEVDLFPQEITRVFLNLISNGFYAATKRKNEIADVAYEPTLAVITSNLGDRVEIRIRDNGTGIPPEVKERMFNPFFTTKPAGEGTGLGLSISHDIIVKQHAGTIEVESQLGEFTEFRVVLPRTAALIAKTGGRA